MAICQAPWFREHQQQTCCDFHVWLVVSNIFYFPFHIWDVILLIDELHHFSRWLWHHQPGMFIIYKLTITNITMENHIFSWENSLFLWQLSWIITNLSGWIGAISLGERSYPVMLGFGHINWSKNRQIQHFWDRLKMFFQIQPGFFFLFTMSRTAIPPKSDIFMVFCRDQSEAHFLRLRWSSWK